MAFPIDIVRQIATAVPAKTDLHNLALTSRVMQLATEPVLYRAVGLETQEQLTQFAKALTGKDSDRRSRYVRTLCINPLPEEGFDSGIDCSCEDLIHMFSQLHNLITLYYCYDPEGDTLILDVVARAARHFSLINLSLVVMGRDGLEYDEDLGTRETCL